MSYTMKAPALAWSCHQARAEDWLQENQEPIDLAFVDPPFNQGKDYRHFDDNQEAHIYWKWMEEILRLLHARASSGASIYFMQREKNSEQVLKSLRRAGWHHQNLIVWRKMSSAVPCQTKYGLSYQIIAFATKGKRARTFNRLRIQPPRPAHHKHERENGLYVTDIWDDIRELTSGYFAGDEPLRKKNGARKHKQQSPLALLVRILLSSSMPGDRVMDPFAGTGTTLIAAKHLRRSAIGIEVDPANVRLINERIAQNRPSDNISKHYHDYRFTAGIDEIWSGTQISLPLAI